MKPLDVATIDEHECAREAQMEWRHPVVTNGVMNCVWLAWYTSDNFGSYCNCFAICYKKDLNERFIFFVLYVLWGFRTCLLYTSDAADE